MAPQGQTGPLDFTKIPIAHNPSGAPPNFQYGPSLQPAILGSGVTLMSIAIVFVTIRLYTGIKKAGKLFADDYLCLVALVFELTQWFVFYPALNQGMGKHTWDIPVSAVSEDVLKRQISTQMINCAAFFPAKGAILVFFLRVFGRLRWVRITCYVLLVLIVIAYGTPEVAWLARCIPHQGQKWDNTVLQRCESVQGIFIMTGVCSVALDLAIFIIPLPIIHSLKLDKQKKRGLAVVFMFGFLVLAASTVGLAYRIILYRGTDDPLWHGVNLYISAYCEVFGTIIVSCAPAISSFWTNIFTQTKLYASFRSTIGSSKHTGTNASSGNRYAKNRESFQPVAAAKKLASSSASSAPDASTEQLVDQPPVPLEHIKQTTVIVQEMTPQQAGRPRAQSGNWDKI